MKRRPILMVSAVVMAMIPVLAGARLGPTPVRYEYDYLPPGGYACPAIPEILGRTGELLGAIDNPQNRSRLAQQWLDYSKKIIAKDMEYRQQWLELQKQQLAQQQQVEQLRLQVARLQLQVEQLRARNAQLESENLQARSKLESKPGPQLSTQAPPAPSPR